ncbi:hypothetical protein D3C76_1012640 [compost metagenome]
MAVAEYLDSVVAVEAAALGIGDAFIGFKRRLFCSRRQLDGFVRGDFSRVEQVQIRGVKRQQLFVCHARVRVWRGVARNIQRGLHGTGNGIRAEIGRRGAAFAILVINRNPQRAVTVKFNVFHFAKAGADANARSLTDRHFCAVGLA